MTHLDAQQYARIEALQAAQQFLSRRGEPDITDLHALAGFILEGGELYPPSEEIRTLSGEVIDSSWAAGIATPVDPAPEERSPF